MNMNKNLLIYGPGDTSEKKNIDIYLYKYIAYFNNDIFNIHTLNLNYFNHIYIIINPYISFWKTNSLCDYLNSILKNTNYNITIILHCDFNNNNWTKEIEIKFKKFNLHESIYKYFYYYNKNDIYKYNNTEYILSKLELFLFYIIDSKLLNIIDNIYITGVTFYHDNNLNYINNDNYNTNHIFDTNTLKHAFNKKDDRETQSLWDDSSNLKTILKNEFFNKNKICHNPIYSLKNIFNIKQNTITNIHFIDSIMNKLENKYI